MPSIFWGLLTLAGCLAVILLFWITLVYCLTIKITKMKKIIVLLMLAFVVAMSLISCSGVKYGCGTENYKHKFNK